MTATIIEGFVNKLQKCFKLSPLFLIKKDLEEASGRGDREDQFEEGDALRREKWRDRVQAIAEGMG